MLFPHCEKDFLDKAILIVLILVKILSPKKRSSQNKSFDVVQINGVNRK